MHEILLARSVLHALRRVLQQPGVQPCVAGLGQAHQLVQVLDRDLPGRPVGGLPHLLPHQGRAARQLRLPAGRGRSPTLLGRSGTQMGSELIPKIL